eukprot:TRINITY_DN7066_c0_g1_i1.p1 TRINITY_DN7066_c0_g1~~TRINITY_DN7066_c0_g1_i1.p1  ORF type:complete len:221 (+),score=32.75 TRINITY_DN7066_c0_g1_i1:57-665(+)
MDCCTYRSLATGGPQCTNFTLASTDMRHARCSCKVLPMQKSFTRSRRLRRTGPLELKARGKRVAGCNHVVTFPVLASLDPQEQKGQLSDVDLPPPGCSRVKVELSRPLGLVLEEDVTRGGIFVAEIIPEGNAEKSQEIDMGDELIATSAIVYNSSESYGGVTVRRQMEIVRLTVRGEKFETVMAAIGTHPAHMKVTLELQKC